MDYIILTKIKLSFYNLDIDQIQSLLELTKNNFFIEKPLVTLDNLHLYKHILYNYNTETSKNV